MPNKSDYDGVEARLSRRGEIVRQWHAGRGQPAIKPSIIWTNYAYHVTF